MNLAFHALKSWETKKYRRLRHFYAKIFGCVIITQYLCNRN